LLLLENQASPPLKWLLFLAKGIYTLLKWLLFLVKKIAKILEKWGYFSCVISTTYKGPVVDRE
jgi:hypothetical protein